MFAPRFFGPRFFGPRFFPPGAVAVEIEEEGGGGGPDLLDEERWLRKWLMRNKQEEKALAELWQPVEEAPLEPEQPLQPIEIIPRRSMPVEIIRNGVAAQGAIARHAKSALDARKAENGKQAAIEAKAAQEAQELNDVITIMMMIASDDD